MTKILVHKVAAHLKEIANKRRGRKLFTAPIILECAPAPDKNNLAGTTSQTLHFPHIDMVR